MTSTKTDLDIDDGNEEEDKACDDDDNEEDNRRGIGSGINHSGINHSGNSIVRGITRGGVFSAAGAGDKFEYAASPVRFENKSRGIRRSQAVMFNNIYQVCRYFVEPGFD